MFKAITAFSTKAGGKDIIDDLVREANEKLGIYRPSTGILYASCPHEEKKLKDILKGICQAFPGIEIIGGTVSGGFTADSGYAKGGCFLCLLVSDTTKFFTGCIRNLSKLIRSNELKQTFRKFLEENCEIEDSTACLICSSYNNIDGNALIDEVQEVLPENCLVFGGMAADYWDEQDIANFSRKTPPAEKTLLFFAKDGVIHIEDDTLVFLVFTGSVTVKYGISYGWSDVGMLYPGRAEGSILTEIDGKNPHTFLCEMKHPLASEEYDHVEYSLWFHVPGKDPYIRDIISDKATNNYYTQDFILPSHFHVSFSFPSKEKILKEFQFCLGRLGSRHDLVIVTTCCTHQVVLEQEICQEYTEMVRMFPRTPIICGYVFGEYGPSITGRKSMLHSCSSIVFCLGEDNRNHNKNGDSVMTFLHETIKVQRSELKSLERQLHFFEGSMNNKKKKLTEDCLGMLLNTSNRSLSSQAERISNSLKDYYEKSGEKPPYAISRNRIIEHLTNIKQHSEKFCRKKP